MKNLRSRFLDMYVDKSYIDITNSLPVNKMYMSHTLKYITFIYFEKTNNRKKNKQAAKIS